MAAGNLDSVMSAAERAQGMLDKNLATAVIVLLFCLCVYLARALVKTNGARVDDVKAINAGLQKYIEENTKSNISLTRAVEAKASRKRLPPPPAEGT